MLSIGLMSGTSMDGIDAALLETDGTPHVINELGHTSITYSAAFRTLLKAAEYAIKQTKGNLAEANQHYEKLMPAYLCKELHILPEKIANTLHQLKAYLKLDSAEPIKLDHIILHSTKLHETCVNQLLDQTGYQSNQIDVVGYHGQTLLHWPQNKLSIAIGDGQYLANQLGIKVVNDFRSRDVAAGGQGAPLAPLYHQALAIRDGRMPLAVINCGGIANVTLINNTNETHLIGFDTGPGNALVDRLVRQRTQGAEQMDVDGHYGKLGQVNESVLKALYEKCIQHDYFKQPPPKSLDYQDMHLIPELATLSLPDACRTLEAFTADTIVNSLDLVTSELPNQWVLSGGGWHNPVIVAELKQRLQHKWGNLIRVYQANEIGWNAKAMEAQLFAYLAVRSLKNEPISFPNTTRVPMAMTGGSLYWPA